MITGDEYINSFEEKKNGVTNSTRDYDPKPYTIVHKGLTIHQYFSSLFMQGLMNSYGSHDVTDYDEMAHDAVLASKALINELNRKHDTE